MSNIHIARILFIVNSFVFTTQISLIHGPTFMHMLSLSCWQDYTLLLKFTFVIRVTLVGILLYMHGSFYGDIMAKVDGTYGYTNYVAHHVQGKTPQRLHVILIDDGYIVGKRYMHGS